LYHARKFAGLALAVALALPLAVVPTAGASIRLAFEYPWFSGTGAGPTHYHPNIAARWPYDSGDPAVIRKQIASAKYGRLQGFIHSWWGQGTPTDSRVKPWLSETASASPGVAGFKNALYYEAEGNSSQVPGSPNPSATQITSDLNYIASRYVSNPSYLRLKGKPVIFVYGGAEDTNCSVATRWSQANAAASTHFYVVLKVFPGYALCASQPDSWHQYAPAVRESTQGQHAMAISPGFFKASEATPRLARTDAQWATSVQHLAAYTGQFQLVTTWNEWGEGTSV
jgi:hypothetical protein